LVSDERVFAPEEVVERLGQVLACRERLTRGHLGQHGIAVHC
jgi:hypothetical protein